MEPNFLFKLISSSRHHTALWFATLSVIPHNEVEHLSRRSRPHKRRTIIAKIAVMINWWPFLMATGARVIDPDSNPSRHNVLEIQCDSFDDLYLNCAKFGHSCRGFYVIVIIFLFRFNFVNGICRTSPGLIFDFYTIDRFLP